MLQERLADIAILLFKVLYEEHDVKFGLFGDYAVSVVVKSERARGADSINCIVSTSKDKLLEFLDGQNGFITLPQAREDHAIFLWTVLANRSNPIMVEMFCETLFEDDIGGSNIAVTTHIIYGKKYERGSSFFLDSFFLFKDKVRLVATRGRFHDSSDLRYLEENYNHKLKTLHSHLDLGYVGHAIKKFVELDRLFERIGINSEAALLASENLDLERVNPPGPFDVQLQLSKTHWQLP